MRFRALPITDFSDITLDLEQVQAFLSNGDIKVDSSGKLARIAKILGMSPSWGGIATGSTTVNASGSNDWTVTNPSGAGTATVTFNATKGTIPTALVTIVGFQGYAIVGAATASAFTINTYNASDVLTSASVNFFAIG